MFWYPLRTTLQGVAQFELSGNPTNRAQGHTSALVTEKIQELTGLHPKRQEYRAAGRGPGNLGSYSIELELAEMSSTETVFLTAEWRDLVMLNYEVDPRVLDKYVPCGTVLDSFLGKTYVSLVGFRFCRTKLFGSLAVPLHSDFDEVNLRFYVRRKEGDENRRGVVFIAEIVPKQAVAMVARLIYGENYVCLPMKHHVDTDGSKKTVKYQWQVKNQWCQLTAQAMGAPELPREGSLEQFITEHYWGYSNQRGGGSSEYHVTHVPWRVWVSATAGFEGDASELYGVELGQILQGPVSSACIADGSPVTVFRGSKLP